MKKKKQSLLGTISFNINYLSNNYEKFMILINLDKIHPPVEQTSGADISAKFRNTN